MSHFTVVVVMDRVPPDQIREEVDKQMAPFMENCCGEPDRIYMKFFDEEDEMRKKYEDDSQEKVLMPDGRLLLPWDKEFQQKPTGEDPFPRAQAPDNLPRRKVPFRETYSSFEEFAEEWYGKSSRDETYNRYGYWQNPNSKWDWFEIGGRWAGFFQLKEGRKGATGSQYNFSEQLEASDGGKADVCLKGAIDFDRMRNEAEDAAAALYDKVQEAIKDTPIAESWEMIKADFPDLKKPGEIEKAREKYHDQPRVKAFSKFGISEVGWMTGVEEFQIPREQYLRNARNNTAVPFAVLKDGKWIEHGNMGWFGMARNEKDPETWNSIVNKMYDKLPDDALLVVCDCHI